ncbi:MAG TPA: hypothetical protein PL105_03620 [Caldilineaceae bacterium]|nr:hypothetical protein [Caldilineaceae bacterium]
MTCAAQTDHPAPAAATTATAAANTPQSPTDGEAANGSATTAADDMIAQAAALARRPAPTANLLYQSMEWYAARPGQRPTPLVVDLWKRQTERIIHQYQDLLLHLVEVQVATIDFHLNRNTAEPGA